MTLNDLCYPMSPDMLGADKPPWENMEVIIHRTIDKDGTETKTIKLGNHFGTHISGPAHLVKGGKNLNELPLDTFYGTGVVLDVTKGPDEAITIDDLKRARPAISKRDIVLLHTGWATKYGSEDYFQHHPYMTKDCASWLVDQGIKMIGADLLSLDLPHVLRKEGFKHTTVRILLENNIPLIEQLNNLGSILAKRVTIMALPINLKGVDSAPARVVAMVDE